MKIILLLLTLGMSNIYANVFSQPIKINLALKNVTIKDAFTNIEKQSNYKFLFRSDLINVDQKINLENSGMTTLDDLLSILLKDTEIEYDIINNNLIVLSPLQQQKITGIVIDAVTGETLPGVTISIQGTTKAVTTGTNGKYTIDLTNKNSVLIFSFVGYQSEKISTAGKTIIEVKLKPDVKTLDEVVVVGYGTQKKVNLTGAVDQVRNEYFKDRPIPNVAHALQGAVPNLNIIISDGKPIRNPSFNIRGTTSIGAGGQALVMIDGVEGNLIDLNPNDIESVTTLKDAASAAIYGARGAFGVVLITTKNPGKSKPVITYTSSYSIKQRTTTPNWVSDGYTWAKMFNESYLSWTDYVQAPKTVNTFFPFSPAYLDELKQRSEHPGTLPDITIDPTTGNYVYYGNTNWLKELYRENIPTMEQSLNVSGGNETMDYMLSGRYYKQGGIFKYNSDDLNKYNLRFKGSIQVYKWLKVTNNTDLSIYDYKYPLQSINQYDVWTNLKLYGFPMAKLLNPDGTLTQAAANNGVGELYYGKSRSLTNQTFFRNTVSFAATGLNNALNVRGDFTYQNTNNSIEKRLAPVSFSAKPGIMTTQGVNYLNNIAQKTNYYTANLYGDYSKSLGKNNLKLLIGGNLELNKYRNLEVQRDELVLEDLNDFNLAVGQNYKIIGGSSQWATLGFFSRFNYNYDNKYLLEINGRYDGASKFPANERFGMFPSVSAGWNVASESFMKGTRNWLDLFKLRASYGSLGNSQISPYMYEQSISATRSGLILNGVNPTYLTQPIVLPEGFTWETSTTFDAGIDINMLKSRLSTTFDWYQRKTTNMIIAGQPLPAVFGAGVPKGNYADLTTTGFELSIKWNDQIKTTKPIYYSFRATLSDNTAVIDRFYNPTGLITTYYEGGRLGDIYGYVADGLFKSEADIQASPNQTFVVVSSGNKLLPGDLKFKDLNNDNKIDRGNNTLQNLGDQKIIGNSTPRYTYAFTTTLDWNNFSLSAFFQGVGKRDWYPGNESGIFWGQYTRWYGQIPQHTIEGTYTIDNPNLNSYFPRYRGPMVASGRELGYPVDRYLQNVSYIRLKDLTIGYSLPKKLIQKAFFTNVRIFLTGQNLWTYSPMFKLTRDIDPEVIENSDPEIRTDMGQGAAYPMLKTYTLGLNLTF